MQDAMITMIETPQIDEGLRQRLWYYLLERDMVQAGQWPERHRDRSYSVLVGSLVGAADYINQLHQALGLEPLQQ